MRRAVAVALLLALVACSREKPTLAPAPAVSTSQPASLQTTPTTSPATTTSLSQTPAAGACLDAPADGIADITLNVDTPAPRCHIVAANTKLRFVNNTDALVTVAPDFAPEESLAPGESHLFPQQVGDHWAPGVHVVRTSLYAGGGPEIWLKS